MTNEESNVYSNTWSSLKTDSCFFQLLAFPSKLGNVINKINLFHKIVVFEPPNRTKMWFTLNWLDKHLKAWTSNAFKKTEINEGNFVCCTWLSQQKQSHGLTHRLNNSAKTNYFSSPLRHKESVFILKPSILE